MEMTTANKKMKNLTAEQKKLVNEIIEREDKQAKIDRLVEAVKERLSKN